MFIIRGRPAGAVQALQRLHPGQAGRGVRVPEPGDRAAVRVLPAVRQNSPEAGQGGQEDGQGHDGGVMIMARDCPPDLRKLPGPWQRRLTIVTGDERTRGSSYPPVPQALHGGPGVLVLRTPWTPGPPCMNQGEL